MGRWAYMTSTSMTRYRVGASVSSVELLLDARTAAEAAMPLASRQLGAGVRTDEPLQVVRVTPGPAVWEGARRFAAEARSGALGTVLIQPAGLVVLADLVMGGRGLAEDRPPTPLEVELVAQRLLEPMATVLDAVAPGRPAAAALVERELSTAARSLVVELSLPHDDAVIGLLVEVFAHHLADGPTDADSARMEAICSEVPLELRFEFSPVSLRAREVAALAPGDVICLDHAAGSPVVGEVDGTPFVTGRVGVARRRAAIEVVDLIDRSE